MISLSEIKNFKIERVTLRTFLILIALGLLFLKLGYQPYKRKLEEKIKLYYDLRAATIQKRILFEKRATSKNPSQEMDVLEASKAVLEVFPKEKDPLLLQVELSKVLTDLAEKRGLKTEELDLILPSSGKRLVEIPIFMRTRGPVKNTLEYLEEVQNFLRKKEKFYKISELTLSFSGNELALSLKISVFKSKL